jgi:hypothetical protein
MNEEKKIQIESALARRHSSEPRPWIWTDENGKRRIKFCTGCGRKYEKEAWEALPSAADDLCMDYRGEIVEVRACYCQTFLTATIKVPGDFVRPET